MPSGDVIVQWGKFLPKLCEKEKIFLQITFVKPQRKIFQIEFKVNEEYTLINAIFKSRGVYIGVGKKGDKVSDKISNKETNDFVLVEVGDTGLDNWWNKKLNKILYKKMKKNGIPKKFRGAAVNDFLLKMDEILNHRMNL